MKALKAQLKNMLPQKLLYLYYLNSAKKASMYDLKRRVYDKVYNKSDIEKVKRDLALAYHIVEKGLTMPEPRPGFGKAVVMSLIDTVEKYEKFKLPANDLEFIQSVSVLKEYLQYHEEISFKLDDDLQVRLVAIRERYAKVEGQRQIRTNKADYFKDKNAPFEQFCLSRYSVRNYTEKEIPMEVIYDCINLAQRSPSFCNRQPNRVHVVKSPEKKKGILEIQNGNRGFGHLAETLIVVSSVVSTTKDMHERFENHLNGGLFSMTLLNALHYREIGACSLNWSVSDDKDMKLREIIDIPHNEVVLMIIACGYLPDEFSIASSPRKTAEEITKMH
ncbi:nitroreductase family protein [Marinifilum sp.]|uniref:nitroreductase family protein n=1 Tax=Marinifilum sp. TaxID=2033137 RepID=UPI003BAB135E